MSGADIRTGRHDGDMGCHGDEYARGGGSRSARMDVDDHGYLGCQELLDDVAHRRIEAARRIEFQQEGFGVPIATLIEQPLDICPGYRADRALPPAVDEQGRLRLLKSRFGSGAFQWKRGEKEQAGEGEEYGR